MRKTRRFHIGKVTAAILLSVTMICTMETPLLAAGNGQVQSTDQEAYKITKNLEQTYTGNVGETVTLEVATNDTENQAVYQWQIKESGTETTKAEGTEAESTGEEPQGTAEGWKNLDGQNQPKLLITVSQEDLNGRLYRCVVTIGEQKLITGEAKIGMPVAQPSQPTGGSQEPESTQPTGESQGPENSQPTGGSQGPENTQLTGGPQGPENTQPTGEPQEPENTQSTGAPQGPENTQPTGSPQGPESTQPTGGSSQSGGENSLNTNLAPVSTEKQPSTNTLTVNPMEQGNTDDGTALTEKKKAEDEKILDNQDDPDSQNKQNNQNNSEDQNNPEDQKDKDILPAPECILRTDTVIAVKAEEGLEYSIDSTSWTETGRFEKLIPDTEYTISARRMAQEGGQPGEAGEKLTVRTKKEALNPPEKPKVLEVTFSSITIETAEGQEYSNRLSES